MCTKSFDSFAEATKNLEYLLSKIKYVIARGTYFNFQNDLCKCYDDLMKLGFKEVNIVPDILDIKSMDDMNKLLYQLDRFHDYLIDYSKEHDDFPFGLFVTQIRKLFIPKIKVGYSCGLGEIIYSIDIKGNIYPCHRHSNDDENIMGNISLVEKVKKYEAEFDKESCIKCWNRYTCMYAKKMTEISIALCAELEKDKLIKILNHR